MSESENKILRTLRRFFSEEQSEEGEQIFNQWYDSVNDSKGYSDRLTSHERKKHKQNVFRSIKDDLNINESPPFRPFLMNRPGKGKMFNRVAAILVIGTVLSLAGAYLSGVSEQEEIAVVMVHKSNPAGQISEITLPDGSTVWLSAASSLKYPEKFSETDRTIELNGEAFFEVIRDTERPFVVNAGPLTTYVLGTTFNIKAYSEDSDIEVTLATGKVEVAVEGEEQKRVLEPNQKVRYEREVGLGETELADASLARAWTQRELVFIRESFGTIAKTFERWYGVDFVFEDEELKEETFVYHFKELMLQNSMNVLNELAEFDYEIEDERVVIRRSKE